MRKTSLVVLALLVVFVGLLSFPQAQSRAATDPGVRGGNAGAGLAIDGLSPRQMMFFDVGKEDFAEVEDVADGLGPRFNLESCGGCHAQPAIGGTSPASNPQALVPSNFPGNVLPPFITATGPVREARFKRLPNGARDGGVHALFVVTGSPEVPNCTIRQEDFAAQVAADNVIFRIPTPVFGAGLIEADFRQCDPGERYCQRRDEASVGDSRTGEPDPGLGRLEHEWERRHHLTVRLESPEQVSNVVLG